MGDGGHGLDAGTALAITSPGSPTYTNKTITIEVTANGSTGAIQLLKNGVALVTLSAAPYAYAWDTTKEAEGSYQIVAQTVVAGGIIMSAPVTIVVDRTPPTITSSSPASGATNVSLTDSLLVVFSESLAPTSVATNAVHLAFGSVAVNSKASLNSDGKTVGVEISDRSSLVLPGSMTETVATAITDLAGNPFAGASWSMSVPLWVDMGTLDGGYPQMVLDADGEPILAVVANADASLIVSRHLRGTTWDDRIPSPATPGTALSSGSFGITSGTTGDLFITWLEGSQLLAARWTGTVWEHPWSALAAGGSPYASAIAATSAGLPALSWVATAPPNGAQQLVAIWTGLSWEQYTFSPPAYGGCRSVPCRIVLDALAFPAVEVGSKLSRWTSAGWTTPAGSSLASLAVNSSNQVLSVQNTGTALQVVALSSTGTLSNYVPVLNASADPISPDDTPQLALDGLNQPVMAWGADRTLHIARWTGATWDQSYGILSPAQGKAALVVSRGSIPIVAWEDNSGAALLTHIAKSNH